MPLSTQRCSKLALHSWPVSFILLGLSNLCAAQATWDSAVWDEAIWDQTVVTHTVTPSSTVGGTITPSVAQTVEDGETISFAIAADSGYQLSAVSGTCPGELSGSTYTAGPIDSDCTVEASFYAVASTTYSVTISAGPNGEVSPSGTVTVNEGSTVTYTATADTGYYVQAWGGGPSANCAVDTYQVNSTVNGDNTNVTFVSTAILGECELNVGFEAISVTATPSTATAGGSVSPSTSQTDTYGSTIDFVLSPEAGYRVDRVEGTCPGSLSGDTYSAGPLAEDCTVLAYFAALPTFTVTPSAGSGGAIDPSTAQSVTESDTASFTLTPENGYQTDSVTGTCGGTLAGNAFTTSPITADCTVIGNFTEVVTLTYDLQGGSTGPGDQTGAADSEISISTSTPTREGYTFLEWNTATDGSGTSYSSGDTYTLPNSGTATLYAQWEIRTFTVTPSAGTGGSISPSTQQLINFNGTASFTLSPDSNYEVASVAGSCGGEITGNTFTTEPVSSDCTVKASFNLRSGTTVPSAPNLVLSSYNTNSASFDLSANGIGSDPISSYTVSCEAPSIASERNSERASYAVEAMGHPSNAAPRALQRTSDQNKVVSDFARVYRPNSGLIHLQPADVLIFTTPDGVEYRTTVTSVRPSLAGNNEVIASSKEASILAIVTENGDFVASIETEKASFQSMIIDGETLVFSSTDNAIGSLVQADDMDWGLVERDAARRSDDSQSLVTGENTPTSVSIAALVDNLTYQNTDYNAVVAFVVSTLNSSAQNAGVDINFTTVGVKNYEPQKSVTSLATARDYITCGSAGCDPLSGTNTTVRAWRDQVKADVVFQLVYYASTTILSTGWGIAQLPTSSSLLTDREKLKQYTYSVTGLIDPIWGTVVDDTVVAHEVGHNFGLYHDRVTLDGTVPGWSELYPPLLPYAHGHRFGSSSGTVMSYASNTVEYFSNPNLSIDDQPIGVPINQTGEAHAAQALIDVMGYYEDIYDNPELTYYVVSASAGVGGSISPASRSVRNGDVTTFTISPDADYVISRVSGCDGTLSGSTYTTGAISGACTVSAEFQQYRWTTTTTGRKATFSGLPEGYQFNCTALATNLAGDSALSATVTFTTQAPTVPSPPSMSQLDSGDGEIYIYVTSGSDGGSPVTGYTATCTDGTNTFTGTSTSSPITVSGLTNEVPYTCTVTATNSVGTSSASAATDPITPEAMATGLPIWLLYQATQ